jgi:hypothetical protein
MRPLTRIAAGLAVGALATLTAAAPASAAPLPGNPIAPEITTTIGCGPALGLRTITVRLGDWTAHQSYAAHVRITAGTATDVDLTVDTDIGATITRTVLAAPITVQVDWSDAGTTGSATVDRPPFACHTVRIPPPAH